MDIDDYKSEKKPWFKRAKLLPFADKIAKLKADGYSNPQVVEWLAQNNVIVSSEAVRVFVNKYIVSGKLKKSEEHQNNYLEENEGTDSQNLEHGLSRREIGQKKAEKYLTQETMSPMTKRLLAKQKEKPDESSSN